MSFQHTYTATGSKQFHNIFAISVKSMAAAEVLPYAGNNININPLQFTTSVLSCMQFSGIMFNIFSCYYLNYTSYLVWSLTQKKHILFFCDLYHNPHPLSGVLLTSLKEYCLYSQQKIQQQKKNKFQYLCLAETKSNQMNGIGVWAHLLHLRLSFLLFGWKEHTVIQW